MGCGSRTQEPNATADTPYALSGGILLDAQLFDSQRREALRIALACLSDLEKLFGDDFAHGVTAVYET